MYFDPLTHKKRKQKIVIFTLVVYVFALTKKDNRSNKENIYNIQNC